jgi:hypothetical protein
MIKKNNTKPLVFIILILLLSNLALIFFFVFNNNPKERRYDKNDMGGLYTSLQNDVGFSQSQLEEYSQMRKEQFKSLKPYFEEVRKSKQDFYSLILLDNNTDSLVQSKANMIGEKQKIVDMKMFNYFKQVQSLCTDGQREKFDSVLKKSVFNKMAGGSSGRGKRAH